VGTPQGAVASPLLANVYLHYVFDLWIESWRKKVAKGDVVIVRYADDLVLGFAMSDLVLAYMKAKGIKLTRKNWLALNYFGNSPAELDAEQEAEIPAEHPMVSIKNWQCPQWKPVTLAVF
jgi:Reverse transcriptase (RNA-dependent DNA polymerase)